MYSKGNINSRLKKIEDIIGTSDLSNVATEMIIGIGDNYYFMFDNEGNRIQITEQEYNKIVFNKKGIPKKEYDIQVNLVDDEYIKDILKDNKEVLNG